ncbi:unnamed protein product [Paramecium sonneborni]|uniref:Uncharacterized protein n=1 Tax=Paramecium sonneborni TaxID=65129 RepID=A0A8S1MJW2_9CILI|nr:unnamed protein product [Paramecium sonneborni]
MSTEQQFYELTKLIHQNLINQQSQVLDCDVDNFIIYILTVINKDQEETYSKVLINFKKLFQSEKKQLQSLQRQSRKNQFTILIIQILNKFKNKLFITNQIYANIVDIVFRIKITKVYDSFIK